MKVKLMERGGATVLLVSGERQTLMICEEGGCFTFALQEEGQEEGRQDVCEEVEEEGRGEVAAVSLVALESTPANGLFGRLATLRKELAAVDNVPPYLIFHNKTLQEMAEKRPKDMHEMAKIQGVGRAKLEKYGEAFLQIIEGQAIEGVAV